MSKLSSFVRMHRFVINYIGTKQYIAHFSLTTSYFFIYIASLLLDSSAVPHTDACTFFFSNHVSAFKPTWVCTQDKALYVAHFLFPCPSLFTRVHSGHTHSHTHTVVRARLGVIHTQLFVPSLMRTYTARRILIPKLMSFPYEFVIETQKYSFEIYNEIVIISYTKFWNRSNVHEIHLDIHQILPSKHGGRDS